MIDLLPLSKIRDEDAPLVGPNITNLAKLSHLGFPVAEGFVVCAPEFKFKSLLRHFSLNDRELFDSSLEIIKKDIEKIPPPKTFDKRIWISLLNIWLSEIRTKIWREGLKDSNWNLSAQVVFEVKKVISSGRAYYQNNQVVIDMTEGSITKQTSLGLEDMVKKANLKLFIPQVYHFIVDAKHPKTFQIVKLTPYTPALEQLDNWDEQVAEKSTNKISSTVKVFLDLSDGMEAGQCDGVLICAERSASFDDLVFRLVESSNLADEVIMKLSDKVDQRAGVRGALSLIHQKGLLKQDVEAFLFARRKKNLLNLSIAVPFVRSVNEFLTLKRELASMGLSRKGSLKLWVEMAVPENLLNIEGYLEAGLDGVIINLDELSSFLGGFDPEVEESVFYSGQVEALIRLLEDPLRTLHKSRVPYLIEGKLALQTEVLAFLIKAGVYGIVGNLAAVSSIDEHLRFVEKRLIRSRLD